MLAHLLVSCANKGVGPQGGPKDTIPPMIREELPVNGAVNFAGKQIVITSNEYLQLKDAANQVFVSPPMRRAPIVKAVGKKVTVSFEEPLRDSTTYIIDFGKAICDLNEGNPLDGYTFAFSTGPVIDTLQMSGTVINALDLNPVQNLMVGIHDDLRDSAFLEKVFVAIAKTDENGRFTFRNLHAGKYHIYALNDASKDYVYQPGEGLAFLDTLFTPVAIDTMVLVPDTSRRAARHPLTSDSLSISLIDSSDSVSVAHQDSISLSEVVSSSDTLVAHQDSISVLSIDSIDSSNVAVAQDSIWIKRTKYGPDDILLKYFTEDKRKLYFIRCLRDEAHKFTLLFAAPQDTMPRFDGLPPCYIQSSAGLDTLTVWLQDSAYISRDTIDFTMTYQQTDSVYNVRWQTDSLRAIYRAPKLSQAQIEARAKEAEKAAKIAAAKAAKGQKDPDPVLELKHNASASFDVYDRLRLTFALPVGVGAMPTLQEPQTPVAPLPQESTDSVIISSIDSTAVLPSDSSDNAILSIEFSAIRLYKISQPQAEGAVADSTEVAMRLFKLDSCGSRYAVDAEWEPEQQYVLSLDSAAFTSIYGLSTGRQQISLKTKSLEEYATLIMRVEPYNERMMIQVLDQKEQVVRTLRADTAGARFEYLKPESYFVRVYEDLNGDSVWTTGDWLHHRQPEPVYYFPTKVQLKANWDFEETVLYLDKNILEQKPTEIRKAVDVSKKK